MDVILCNSHFTRLAILDNWRDFSIPGPVVVYPATLRQFDSSATFPARQNRAVYVARLSSFKRHEIMKELAQSFPSYSFVSTGSANAAYARYLSRLRKGKPPNYQIIENASWTQVRDLLQSSKLYVHCARDEHFGISIVEAMSAGCVPLVHASGGPREFVPEALVWKTIGDLRELCARLMEQEREWTHWKLLVNKIARQFTPERFEQAFAKNVFGG